MNGRFLACSLSVLDGLLASSSHVTSGVSSGGGGEDYEFQNDDNYEFQDGTDYIFN